jgi:casein kinase II subunit beta
VDEDFIQDDFNLCGLATQATYYNYALGELSGTCCPEMAAGDLVLVCPSFTDLPNIITALCILSLDTILDVDIPEGELDERQQELVEVSAETLYGLIHARFILTARGMNAMLSKYTDGAFGRCPRVYCGGQTVLPVGQSDMPRCSTVKIFCPMCWDLYFPRSRTHNTLDGSYWGTTFPHLFLHTYQTLVPQRNHERYVPRIYGFKIHKSAAQVQRNLGLLDGGTPATMPSNGPNGQRAAVPVHMITGALEENAADILPDHNDIINSAPTNMAVRAADVP